jgi:hypothetical protein
MTLQEYLQGEWCYPELNFRAMDADGSEYYYNNEPMKIEYMYTSITGFPRKRGRYMPYGHYREFWTVSLQSRDQFLNLQNIEK